MAFKGLDYPQLDIGVPLLPYTDLGIKGSYPRPLQIPGDLIPTLGGVTLINPNDRNNPRLLQGPGDGSAYVTVKGGVGGSGIALDHTKTREFNWVSKVGVASSNGGLGDLSTAKTILGVDFALVPAVTGTGDGPGDVAVLEMIDVDAGNLGLGVMLATACWSDLSGPNTGSFFTNKTLWYPGGIDVSGVLPGSGGIGLSISGGSAYNAVVVIWWA